MQKTETSTDTVSSKGAPDSIESIRKQSKIPKKGLTRRSFLKASAFVAGTAAALGGVGCSSAESGADNGAADERIVATRCTWSGCANCQQNTTVRNGRVVKVDSVPNEPWGNRVCLRGRAQVQRVNNPNRLKYPMKRVGERGSGEWEQITWDEAISTVTNTWNDIIKQYGSKAIVNYSAVGNFGWLSAGLYTRLCNVMQFSKIDSSLDLAMPKGLQKVYGGSGYWMPAAEDPDNMLYSKYAVFWGTNVSEALMQLYRRVLDAQEAGTRIVVVSPIKSTVANIADLWVPVRTASDTILVSAMIKYIIEEELYDKDFITEHSNAPFLVKKDTYDQLRMSDMGVEPTEGPVNPTTRQPTIIDPGVVYDLDTKTFVQEGTVSNPALTGTWTIDGEECVTALDLLHETVMQYTPEYASPLCGIDPDTITELARICCDGPVLHAIANGGAAYDNGVAYGQSIWRSVGQAGNAEHSGRLV